MNKTLVVIETNWEGYIESDIEQIMNFYGFKEQYVATEKEFENKEDSFYKEHQKNLKILVDTF